MVYKNTTNTTHIYYGVEFKPGDIHTVPGHISNSKFVRLPDDYVVDVNKGVSEPVVVKSTKTKKEESDDGSNCN